MDCAIRFLGDWAVRPKGIIQTLFTELAALRNKTYPEIRLKVKYA